MVEFIKDFEPDDEFETTLQYERNYIWEGKTFIKQMYQKNVCFVIIGTLKMLHLNLSQVFVMNVVLDVSFQKHKLLCRSCKTI